MIFFTDTDELKQYVGGVFENDFHISALAGAEHNAIYTHLVPRIGEDFYLDLKTAVEADSTNTAQDDLLPYFKRALAHLAAFEWARVGAVSINDGGITRKEIEGSVKSAYKYQEKELRVSLLEHGYTALEQLLKFLVDNNTDYPPWDGSPEYEATTGHFINFATEVQQAYGKSIDRYTFDTMLPIVDDIELFVFEPLLGKTTFDDLRGKVYDAGSTSYEKEAIRLIRKALAAYSIRYAIERQLVTLRGGRVMFVEENSIEAMYKTNIPTNDKLLQRLNADREMAERYLSRIRYYLKENSTEFPDYEVPEESTDTQDETWSVDDPYSCPDEQQKGSTVHKF